LQNNSELLIKFALQQHCLNLLAEISLNFLSLIHRFTEFTDDRLIDRFIFPLLAYSLTSRKKSWKDWNAKISETRNNASKMGDSKKLYWM
jgi:hypothetical protein